MRINNIFLLLNLTVLALLFFVDIRGSFVEFSITQLVLLIIFQIFLVICNKKIKNKILDLLILHILIFYTLRIPFIFFDNFLSDVISRNVDVHKINNSLLVLNIQILIFSLIIILLKPLNNLFLNINNLKPAINNAAVLKFTLTILILHLFNIYFFWFNGDLLKIRFISIFFSILSISVIEILLFSLLFLNRNLNYRKLNIYIFFQLFLCLLLGGVSGSKSTAIQVLEYFIIFVLLTYGSQYIINIKRFLFLIGFITYSFVGYLMGHKLNHIREGLIGLRLTNPEASINNLNLAAFDKFTTLHPFQSLSYRMGYLDFFIDKFSQEIYLKAFNSFNYFKAVVDGLTPGFNVWGDIPLVSRAVFNSYFGASAGPNSEAITIFAEASIFLGHLSGIIYFVVLNLIYIFGRLSLSIARNDYEKLLALFFTGFCFEQYLSGFGMDYWILANVFYLMVSFIVSLMFIRLLSINRSL